MHWYSFAAKVQLFIQKPVGSFKVVNLDLDSDTALLLSLGSTSFIPLIERILCFVNKACFNVHIHIL